MQLLFRGTCDARAANPIFQPGWRIIIPTLLPNSDREQQRATVSKLHVTFRCRWPSCRWQPDGRQRRCRVSSARRAAPMSMPRKEAFRAFEMRLPCPDKLAY